MATNFLLLLLLLFAAAVVAAGICVAVWALVRGRKRQKRERNLRQEELERMKIDDL